MPYILLLLVIPYSMTYYNVLYITGLIHITKLIKCETSLHYQIEHFHSLLRNKVNFDSQYTRTC